jgi:hypothetical protein
VTAPEAIARLEASNYTQQLLRAAKDGLACALAGTEAKNPYPDKRTPSGRVTFSRSFRAAWARGYSLGQLVTKEDT